MAQFAGKKISVKKNFSGLMSLDETFVLFWGREFPGGVKDFTVGKFENLNPNSSGLIYLGFGIFESFFKKFFFEKIEKTRIH